ncbi:ubiquitin-like protein [Hesseltinella vesiculosa]|uniref:Ubiquitin-like protein n=1 Tax=Hesseltinella vesiculosa TaxID=101127 RepID=A0A1X2G641_9FUNG|nr:ubiquitin-like protein [Hesseltinella vesiculosa]
MSDTQGKIEKKEPGASTDHINLKVVGADNNEVFFKIKRSTPLRKLMDAFCERQGKAPGSVRFLYDGNRVLPVNTPDELDMEDGDTIDVMVEQIGGFQA